MSNIIFTSDIINKNRTTGEDGEQWGTAIEGGWGNRENIEILSDNKSSISNFPKIQSKSKSKSNLTQYYNFIVQLI